MADGFGWHSVDGVAGDATPHFQAALDSADFGNGGRVVVPPSAQPYRIDGTIEIGRNRELYVSAGAVLDRPAPTDGSPLVRMAGNRARLTGEGLIRTADSSPNGLVKVGPASQTFSSPTGVVNGTTTVTDPSGPFATANVGDSFSVKCPKQKYFNTTITAVNSPTRITTAEPVPTTCDPAVVFWMGGDAHSVVASQIRNVRLRGVEATGNVGVLMQSAPQGGNFGTFGNLVRDVYMDGFGDGLLFDAQANANFGRDVYFRDMVDHAIWGRNSDEWSFHGGFVQSSPGATMVKLTNVFGSQTWQLLAEPGGKATPFKVDADCQDNVVMMMDNINGAAIDDGLRTTTWTRSRLSFGHDRIGFYDDPPTRRT